VPRSFVELVEQFAREFIALPRTATKYLEGSVLSQLFGLRLAHLPLARWQLELILGRQVRQLFEDSARLILDGIIEWTIRHFPYAGCDCHIFVSPGSLAVISKKVSGRQPLSQSASPSS
jgi:hypothetical protein